VKELGIQGELVKAAVKAGGYAYKANNRFLVGILDLVVLMPGHFAQFIEVKYQSIPNRGNTARLSLTPHQQDKIKKITEAGHVAGWVMVVGAKGEYNLVMGCEPHKAGHVLSLDGSTFKKRGAPWPIAEIVQQISDLSGRGRPPAD
jgi:hypothetical protein